MSVIIIPRKHLRQPTGRVQIAPEFAPDYAYAPWMGASKILGADSGLFSQTSISGPLVSTGGVGTTYSGTQGASASAPKISAYPFALAAVIEILPSSGNVYAESALGVGDTGVSSPATIGVTSSFIGDARPSFRVGTQLLAASNSAHGRVSRIVAVAESATSRALYVDGALVATSSASATMFQAGAPSLALHAVREYNFGSWNTTNANLRVLGGGWFRRLVSDAEARALSANVWQLFHSDPIRIYSFPVGAISLSINSIAASSITQTGARITLGLTR